MASGHGLTHAAHLAACASAYPTRTALSDESGRHVTYRELDMLTNELAVRLASDAAIGRGDVVGWMDWNSIEYLLMYYATAKLGARILPLNMWLRTREIEMILERTAPKILFVGPEGESLPDRLPRTTAGVRRIVESADFNVYAGQVPKPVDLPRVNENEIHEVICTSGSTGEVKAVIRSQRSRLLDSYRGALLFGLMPDDHMLWFLPQFHIGGGGGPNQLLVQGGRVTIMRKFDAAGAVAQLNDGVTVLWGVPTHYEKIAEIGVPQGNSVRAVYVGGTKITREVLDRLGSLFPCAELMQGYGSTETGGHTMGIRGQMLRRFPDSVGLPAAGTEVQIVDADGAEVADGTVGEIRVRSEANMLGYLGEPELTDSVLTSDGWLSTGDLGRRGEDGTYYITGRAKDVIITGGENVDAGEVEQLIGTDHAVQSVAVIGVPDDVYGERVVAYVVRTAEAEPFACVEDRLRAIVAESLAGFKAPREYLEIDNLPYTATGKLQRAVLRQQYATRERAVSE